MTSAWKSGGGGGDGGPGLGLGANSFAGRDRSLLDDAADCLKPISRVFVWDVFNGVATMAALVTLIAPNATPVWG